jgi:hypothetical protein
MKRPSRAGLLMLMFVVCLALGYGCSDDTGTVNLEAAKAAAEGKSGAPSDRPEKPIRNVNARPKSAPARTPGR